MVHQQNHQYDFKGTLYCCLFFYQPKLIDLAHGELVNSREGWGIFSAQLMQDRKLLWIRSIVAESEAVCGFRRTDLYSSRG